MNDVFRALRFPPTIQKHERGGCSVWVCEWAIQGVFSPGEWWDRFQHQDPDYKYKESGWKKMMN